jgi:hypothetical protein
MMYSELDCLRTSAGVTQCGIFRTVGILRPQSFPRNPEKKTLGFIS